MPQILTKLRWNAFVLWHARNERRLPYQPIDQIHAIQSRRARAMIQHAYRNVPFYRQVMDERGLRPDDFQTAADLTKLPIVDKETYIRQPDRFIAANADGAGLTLHSSGTSGIPKTVRQDARAMFLALAQGQRQRLVTSHFVGRPFGYRETRFTRALGSVKLVRDFYEEYSWTPHRIDVRRQRIPPGEMSLEDTVAAVNNFRPDVMIGYGSYLGPLFREIHHANTAMHRPKLIQYMADSMPEADRLFIEQEFAIPVISTYQSTEVLRIGFYCEQRTGFHLSLDAMAARILDDDNREVAPGESGHLIVSNLTNRATVLLNYRLGDIVTRGKIPCPCGRTLPMIQSIRGRSGDLLRLADGRIMHGLVATELVLGLPGVRQVQLVQHALDRFVLRAIAKPSADKPQLEAALADALLSRVGNEASVRVEWMDLIPPGPNGKVKAVISEID